MDGAFNFLKEHYVLSAIFGIVMITLTIYGFINVISWNDIQGMQGNRVISQETSKKAKAKRAREKQEIVDMVKSFEEQGKKMNEERIKNSSRSSEVVEPKAVVDTKVVEPKAKAVVDTNKSKLSPPPLLQAEEEKVEDRRVLSKSTRARLKDRLERHRRLRGE